jgi:hypothetical protein
MKSIAQPKQPSKNASPEPAQRNVAQLRELFQPDRSLEVWRKLAAARQKLPAAFS